MEKRSKTLTVSRPFSLKATALSHGWHECAPMSWSEGGRCLQIIEADKGEVYRVSVTEGGSRSGEVKLRVVVEGSEITNEVMKRLAKRVRIALRLDEDLSEFYELCREHPTLHVLPRIGGGRIVRSASMSENVLKAICATNVNWTQAVKMINRVAQLGPHVPHFRHLNAWPAPRVILRAGETYLKEVCRLGYRVDSILEFCAGCGNGAIDLDEIQQAASNRETTSEQIVKMLRTIKGIGPSSAHYLNTMLGRYDRLSIDSATIAYVADAHMKGKKPTPRQIEKIYAPYGRWKNLVWWFEQWLTWGTARQILAEAGVKEA